MKDLTFRFECAPLRSSKPLPFARPKTGVETRYLSVPVVSRHTDFSQLSSGVSQAVGLSDKYIRSILELLPQLSDRKKKLILGFET